VITLTKYIATRHGRQGIRCNAVAPGLMLTEAVAAMPPMFVDLIKSHVVTSDEARFITDQTISIDGGFLAHSPQFPDVMHLSGRSRTCRTTMSIVFGNCTRWQGRSNWRGHFVEEVR